MRLTESSARPQSAKLSKSISELDPNATSIEECEAALVALFNQHSKFAAGGRKPKLFAMGDGTESVTLAIIGQSAPATPEEGYKVGKCEGLFLGELLGSIPPAQRPMHGPQQTIASLPVLAQAIISMNNAHQWNVTMPIANGRQI